MTACLAHACRSLGCVFFTTGLVFGTWAARIPAVQARLDLGPGELAVVILGIEAGAIAGLAAAGACVARTGSRATLTAAISVFGPALVTAGAAPALGWLAAGLALWAAANGVIDVAMNSQGAELERRAKRPLLSRLHAAHSFGLLAGGLLAVAAAAAGVPVLWHAIAVAAVAVIAGLLACRGLVAGAGVRASRAKRQFPRALVLLGAIAFCCFLIEGAAANWIAVQLRIDRGASPAVAAAGYSGFCLSLALGRLAGDHLVARHGRARVVRLGGATAALGVLVAITAPMLPGAIAGWLILGAGVSVLAPTVLGAAATVDGVPLAAAIAAVSIVGYAGSFTGPPGIGALAELTGISRALIVLALAGLVAALLARALAPAPVPGGATPRPISTVSPVSSRSGSRVKGGRRP